MPRVRLPALLLEQATAPYRPLGNYAWRFARGKLGADPAFASLLKRGLIPAGARVLDLSCGQGLLAALLGPLTGSSPAEQAWPANWAPPPVNTRVHGIEQRPRPMARARQALEALGERVRLTHGDLREAEFGETDVAVLLDVLHYMNYPAQDDVLRRVKASLAPGGTLLLRVGDAAAGLSFRISAITDLVLALLRHRRFVPLYCRTLHEWLTLLRRLGFKVEAIPMHRGTPYANVLIVARLPLA